MIEMAGTSCPSSHWLRTSQVLQARCGRLFKFGARVQVSARRFVLHLPSPLASLALWQAVVLALGAPPASATVDPLRFVPGWRSPGVVSLARPVLDPGPAPRGPAGRHRPAIDRTERASTTEGPSHADRARHASVHD